MPADLPDVPCKPGSICVKTTKQWSHWESLSSVGIVGTMVCTAAEPCGVAEAISASVLVAYLAYKNKDAMIQIEGQIVDAVEHIQTLNNDPGKRPRNHWRGEIKARIDKARMWANRMSPGKRQDLMNRLIDAVEKAVPQD
ncbi:MAG TPA: hypothetical protein VN822_04435 [Candidatus Acidoferrales bacterium]|nr:hypothetical protein [Candidatus Acidoferrales bacterium]